MKTQNLWTIIVAAAIFSLIAMWSMPGFPAPMAPALDQARDAAMRPLPALPPTTVSPPDGVWVPDRYVDVPGSGGQAHIPAHWDRRLPDGGTYVPPLTGSTPEGQVVPFPAGSLTP